MYIFTQSYTHRILVESLFRRLVMEYAVVILDPWPVNPDSPTDGISITGAGLQLVGGLALRQRVHFRMDLDEMFIPTRFEYHLNIS